KRRPLSLNVQLPSSLKLAFCSPRDSADEHQGIEQYLQHLEQEIDLVGCHLDSQQRVEQFHLGGATLTIAHIGRLMSHLRRRFNFLLHDCGDYSVEVDLYQTD